MQLFPEVFRLSEHRAGGGYGDPLKRDHKFVALEVHRGLVSFEGARRYGVVVNPDFSVDEQATEALRAKITSARPVDAKPEIFNRGGTWEELRANALVETGLPAPKLPWEVRFFLEFPEVDC